MEKPQLAAYSMVRTENFPPRSGIGPGYSLLTILSNIALEFLARVIRQEKEIKDI
jgi:hypothetical protein